MTPEIVQHFRALFGPWQRAISLMVGRGVVTLSDDSGPLQTVQMTGIGGQPLGKREVLGQYGFASRMKRGAETVHLAVGGQRSHQIVIAVGDRRYRLKNLQEGEVALHDDQGQVIHLTRAGIVINGAARPVKIINTPSVRMECDLDVTGEIKDHCDGDGRTMAAMRSFDTTHHHQNVQSGSSLSGPSQEAY
jgi:phage baseplate assembly protein V